jgi:alkylhydroperoxidase/carboxymuconolactone decarboxylase family protein YurZ
MSIDQVFRVLGLGEVDTAGQTWRDLMADVGRLDPRLESVAQVAVLVALGGPEASFAVAVDRAIGAGLTPDELVQVLLAVAPTVGTAKLVRAAPALASGLGIDVDQLLESDDPYDAGRQGPLAQSPSPNNPTARAASTASPRDVTRSFR